MTLFSFGGFIPISVLTNYTWKVSVFHTSANTWIVLLFGFAKVIILKWLLIVALICISLIANKTVHFTCLLAINLLHFQIVYFYILLPCLYILNECLFLFLCCFVGPLLYYVVVFCSMCVHWFSGWFICMYYILNAWYILILWQLTSIENRRLRLEF